MKISTCLILACVGLILFAVLYDNKGGSPSPGLPGSGSGAPGVSGAPASSAWFSSRKSLAAPSSTTSSSPGLLASALAFVKRSLATAGPRTSWRRSELRIARGPVVDQVGTALVLDCSGWIVRGTVGIYAGDGLGMNAIRANLVDAHELLAFGHLMTVDHGMLRQSGYDRSLWTTDSYLFGPVLVKGCPSPGSGKSFKVVVAPDGSALWHGQSIPAYTASFSLGADTPTPKGW